MTHAIRIYEHGGPEVMKWEAVEVGAPGEKEARIRHTVVGLNYIDTYHRSGLYKLPLPTVIGREGAGVVEAIGAGVTGLKVGDRVAYGAAPIGSYAEARLIPADRLVKIPDNVTDQQAASIMLKGMTSQYLLRRTHPVVPGDIILCHAAAGGVGLILCQWAKHLGATVIGTVGNDDKVALARANGCDHVINYAKEDYVARVAEITGGKKCDVVYDAVGKDTFPSSLDCLKPMGMWVSFGQSSGLVPPFQVNLLQQKGSLFATRPTTAHYFAKSADLAIAAANLFSVLQNGSVRVEIGQTFPLKDAAEAHRALEARRTSAATVLIP